MNLSLEYLVAAIVDQEGGEIFLGREYMEKNLGGQAIAIEYDHLRDGYKITLMKEKDIEYDDE